MSKISGLGISGFWPCWFDGGLINVSIIYLTLSVEDIHVPNITNSFKNKDYFISLMVPESGPLLVQNLLDLA